MKINELKSTLTSRKKTKRRGRSQTILTGPEGVEDQNFTLGRRSL